MREELVEIEIGFSGFFRVMFPCVKEYDPGSGGFVMIGGGKSDNWTLRRH